MEVKKERGKENEEKEDKQKKIGNQKGRIRKVGVNKWK